MRNNADADHAKAMNDAGTTAQSSDAASKLTRDSAWNGMSVTSTNSAAVSASVTGIASATSFGIKVKEVIIYNLQEGIFFAKLVCERDGQLSDIDARTSDAIALAVRFECPIYTFESILSSAGILSDEFMDEDDDPEEDISEENEFQRMTKDELEQAINEAIENEDYERASMLRDEINKRS